VLKQERNSSHLFLSSFWLVFLYGYVCKWQICGEPSSSAKLLYFLHLLSFSNKLPFSQYRRIWAFRNTLVNFGTRFENKVIIIIILLSSLNISLLKNISHCPITPPSNKNGTGHCHAKRQAVYFIKTSVISLWKLTNYPCKWGIMTKKLIDKWHKWQRESLNFCQVNLLNYTHIPKTETKKEITYFYTAAFVVHVIVLFFAVLYMLINKCRVLYSLALLSPSTWSLLLSSPLSLISPSSSHVLFHFLLYIFHVFVLKASGVLYSTLFLNFHSLLLYFTHKC